MWALFATLAGTVWAASNLIEKQLLDKRAKSVWGTLVLFELCNSVAAVVLVALGWQSLYQIWFVIAAAALGNIIGVTFYLFALQQEEISRVVPLWLLAMIILPLGDAIFLHHILSTTQYAAMAVMTLLGFLLVFNWQRGVTHSIKVFLFMVLSTAGYSSMWLLGDTVIDKVNPIYFTGGIFLLRSTVILATSVLIGWWHKSEHTAIITRSNVSWAAITTVASLAGFMLYFQSLRGSAVPALVETFTLVQYALIFIVPLVVNKFKPQTYEEQFSVKQLLQKFFLIGGMVGCALVLLFSSKV